LPKSWLFGGAVGDFIDVVERVAKRKLRRRKPRSFIVHGRDTRSLHELVHFIQHNLGWPPPRILRELPSKGLTIIEKFEEAASGIDVVFVLLTPDDKAALVSAPNDLKRRARQNVIFELGFFLAKLQRIGGRVILLHRGAIELPSDIAGIGYVDISTGVNASGEAIRKELGGWLQ
jgi:predicted nucleotide-binding protein